MTEHERREFVKVERMGDKARYSVEIPITMDTIHARMDELELRISDVNDAALYDFAMLEKRIDALEQRIEESIISLCATVSDLKVWVDAHKNGITQEDFYARQFVYWAVNKEPLERLDVLERRIKRIERLLSHKTGKLAGNDLGAVFLDELGQEEQGGADELADD